MTVRWRKFFFLPRVSSSCSAGEDGVVHLLRIAVTAERTKRKFRPGQENTRHLTLVNQHYLFILLKLFGEKSEITASII